VVLLVVVLVMLGSATKLQTARTIGLSGGATGTATSFNGTGNITIPVTSLDATKLSGTAKVSTTGNAGTATKLATARKIALTGAVSGNANFDGSGNINITTTQANIAVLTGTITTPDANSDTVSATTTFSYPSGFNANNCVIIGLMSHNNASTGSVFCTTGGTGTSAENMRGNYGLQGVLKESDIQVYVSKVDKVASSTTISVKLVLMKIS